MTHDEMIAILAAHRDGRRIQWKPINGRGWSDYTKPDAPIHWNTCKYRIKPGVVCKTTIQVNGHAVYVEGGPGTAKKMEREFHRVEFPGTLEPFTDDSPREEFKLKRVRQA